MTTSVFSTMLQRSPISVILVATQEHAMAIIGQHMRDHAITPRVVDAGLLDPVDFTPMRISRKGQDPIVVPARTPTARVDGEGLILSNFQSLPVFCVPGITSELRKRRLGWTAAKERAIGSTVLASWHTMILVDEHSQEFLIRIVREHPALAQLLTSRD